MYCIAHCCIVIVNCQIVLHIALAQELGCISNTASYLRLWALSLAHSQLASVFLEKALLGPVEMNGAAGVVGSVIGYGALACIIFAVLLCMDNLECFLHALRLQWVELQSKFLKGDGIGSRRSTFGWCSRKGRDQSRNDMQRASPNRSTSATPRSS